MKCIPVEDHKAKILVQISHMQYGVQKILSKMILKREKDPHALAQKLMRDPLVNIHNYLTRNK